MRRIVAVLLVWSLASVAVGDSAVGSTGRPLLVTVDDLPIAAGQLHPEPTERLRITTELLAVLRKHDVKAVGFVTWRNVRDASDRKLLAMWLDAGHELGNHSRDHLDYRRTAIEDYIADIEAARIELTKLLGEHDAKLRLFRFPFLREGDTVDKLTAMRDYLEATGQRNLDPTIDTQDWSFETPWVTARRAGDEAELVRVGDAYQRSLRLSVEDQERLGDGLFERATAQVLLLHANEVGAAQWDELFTWLRGTGYRFATVDEVLADSAVTTPHDYVGERGPGLWRRIRAERDDADAERELRALLLEQSEAWNGGDLDAFCSVYASDARFLSPSGVTQGRDQVLARYRTRYPDGDAMGTLGLEVLGVRLARGEEVSMLGDAVPSRVHGAAVAARWTLSYPDQEARSGLTLIVFRRAQGRWWIVEDASM